MIKQLIDTVLLGKCESRLTEVEDNSIDAIVTDFPYALNFMGASWDKDFPSIEALKEMLRILKPGAFLVSTFTTKQNLLARMILRLEDAGFFTEFTSLYWAYARGMPKIFNIQRMIKDPEDEKGLKGAYAGFNPKPAVEAILIVMKPLSEKSHCEQAMSNGKGVTWMDRCRIPPRNEQDLSITEKKSRHLLKEDTGTRDNNVYGSDNKPRLAYFPEKGRYPANVLVSDDVLNDGINHRGCYGNPSKVKKQSIYRPGQGEYSKRGPLYADEGSFSRYFDLDRWWEVFNTSLPEKVKTLLPFLVANKASRKERDKGMEYSEELDRNEHHTVKSLSLFSYLITMFSRENDIILDPYCGSGTTCISAKVCGRKFIGIDQEEKSVKTARIRLAAFQKPLFGSEFFETQEDD